MTGWMQGRIAVAALLALGVAAGTAQAEFPERPITLLVPFAPGGGTDITARVIAQGAEARLGQPIVVVNRPGAGGAIALDETARAEPDGYTLVVFSAIAAAIAPHMQEVPFSPLEDFTPIMNYGAFTTFIAVRSSSDFQTLDDLIAYAKENPRALTTGVSAIGASSHLGMARLMAENDAAVTFVPFGGGAPAVTALLGGHLAVAVTSGEILPHVRSGDVRLLGLLQDAKVAEFPDLPNVRELGYDWDLESWLGIAGPAGLDADVLAKLEAAFTEAMDDEAFKAAMEDLAMLTVYQDHAAAARALAQSYEDFGRITEDLGIGLFAR
jgi:tripartite-type tricarboxylate transporter receptor subunit TctC